MFHAGPSPTPISSPGCHVCLLVALADKIARTSPESLCMVTASSCTWHACTCEAACRHQVTPCIYMYVWRLMTTALYNVCVWGGGGGGGGGVLVRGKSGSFVEYGLSSHKHQHLASHINRVSVHGQ